MTSRYPLVLVGTAIQELQAGDTVAGLVPGTDVQVYDAATAKTNLAQTWSKNQRANYSNTDTVTTTSSYTFDGSTKSQVNLVTLTGAITVTFAAPANIVEGTYYTLVLKAGDTSARTFAWNSAYKFPAGTAPLSSGTITSGAVDIITFIGGATNVMYYTGHQTDVR